MRDDWNNRFQTQVLELDCPGLNCDLTFINYKTLIKLTSLGLCFLDFVMRVRMKHLLFWIVVDINSINIHEVLGRVLATK